MGSENIQIIMKIFLFIFIILFSSHSFAYINETYDCKMRNFIGIDKDGLPKKWREQKFSFKWKDDFTIQFGKGGYFNQLVSERIGWFSANKDSFNIHHDIYIMNYANNSFWFSHVNPESGILNIHADCKKRK
tara:strand:+ start:392 stop:787 length:396 start_codon:yes stop_codon:yes gene_type:complete